MSIFNQLRAVRTPQYATNFLSTKSTVQFLFALNNMSIGICPKSHRIILSDGHFLPPHDRFQVPLLRRQGTQPENPAEDLFHPIDQICDGVPGAGRFSSRLRLSRICLPKRSKEPAKFNPRNWST